MQNRTPHPSAASAYTTTGMAPERKSCGAIYGLGNPGFYDPSRPSRNE